MNKIAKYLNEHLLGEVVVSSAILKRFSTDLSPLEYVPDMIIHPRVTNDIRKVARFAWQLAEKGHSLGLTARGSGSDKTGAAIGSGMIISTTAYMDEIYELDAKQKLMRVQPGATIKAINDTLAVRGLTLPPFAHSKAGGTIGGAIANNARGQGSAKYGDMKQWVSQLEVILASGDVVQTGRLSRRELERIKGTPGYEGEIYRQIDGLIEDNRELISTKIAGDKIDRLGYPGIAEVKRSDGSFDLMPLFLGSQGTLGIICEMIIKADFVSRTQDVFAVILEGMDNARDTVEVLAALKPTFINIYDAELFRKAAKKGKTYSFYKRASEGMKDGVVLLVGVDDFGRARGRKLKKIVKTLNQLEVPYAHASEDNTADLLALGDVVSVASEPDNEKEVALPIIDGAHVPRERLGAFIKGVDELEKKHHISLPLYGHALESIFYTRPMFQLQRVSDKQKIFKIIDQYCQLVESHGGAMVAENGEGRLKASFVYRTQEPEVLELYKKIKEIFDPYGILNPGVKQQVEIKELATHLRTSYDETLPI